MKSTIILALVAIFAYSVNGVCQEECATVCNLTANECRLVAGIFAGVCDIQATQCATTCTTICTCFDQCQATCDAAQQTCAGDSTDIATIALCEVQSLSCVPDCEAQCVITNAVGGLGQGLQGILNPQP